VVNKSASLSNLESFKCNFEHGLEGSSQAHGGVCAVKQKEFSCNWVTLDSAKLQRRPTAIRVLAVGNGRVSGFRCGNDKKVGVEEVMKRRVVLPM
jgi:hypothetical protein